MIILAFEGVRGVGILAAPMGLACSHSKAGCGRVPLGGSTRAGASATALSTDCYDCHCMPGCRTLYSQKKDSQLSVLWRTRGGVCRRDQWYAKQSAYGMGITL